MRTKSLVGIVMAVSTLCLVFSSLWLRAQHVLSPNPDFADALWLAHADGIHKIAADDATVLFTMSDVNDVWTLTVDAPRGVLWAYGRHTLSAYHLNGQPLISIPLTPPASSGNSKDAVLSVNSDDGSVWLGIKTFLYHFNAQGQWLGVHSLPDPVQALAWDPTRTCLWVGTKERVQALDAAGALCATLDVGAHPDVRALAVDATTRNVWVGLHKGLRHYDASGTLRFELHLDKLATLEGDPQGGVWAATDRELLHIDGSGLLRLAVEPFSQSEKIVDLVVDPRDASVWVASKKQLGHLGADGRRLHEVKLGGAIRDLAFYADVTPPSLAFSAPQDGIALNTNTPAITLQYGDSGTGVDPATLIVQANGVDVSLVCQYSTSTATCTPSTLLPEGPITLTATIQDYAGNMATAPDVRVTVDTIAPVITLTAPADGVVTNQAQQTFMGSLSEAATLTLNGEAVAVDADLTFTHGPLALQEGFHLFELVATDAVGNTGRRHVRVTVDTTAPAAVASGQVEVRQAEPGQVQVTGPAGSVEAGAQVTVTNLHTGQAVTVTAEADGSFTATLAAEPGDMVAIVVADAAGNSSPESQVPVGGTLPPDPQTVAPPLDRTVATDLATATAFLYSGSRPIQTGVAPETIEPRRVAILRGQVKTHEDAPLPGVTITILAHPEFGQTLTRADGLFDLAVNGGGLLTVRYEKEGYIPAQRQVQAPWGDYAWLPDVVLLPYDAQVTTIDLATLSEVQAARGSVETDADGARQATLLFAPGTQATMVLPDGTTQPLTTMHVRATEYTVGDNGPLAMPAQLPSHSAYTYAVELSVDEAVAAGAPTVQFTQPVIFYVENFLNFPVGTPVPMGFYDRENATWVASQNGRIVALVSITDGFADLDSDGDGVGDDAATLAALGVTDAERQRLASLYDAGQSLWRIPITHFSAWDANWGWSPPPEATPPLQPDPKPEGGDSLDENSCQPGSIIKGENQTLGETVSLTGTSFRLHYQSDRVPGYKAANIVVIPLSGASVPSSLRRIEVEIDVAGQRVRHSVPAAPNQSLRFTWDGQDAYGRPLQGSQPIAIRLGYVYSGVYQQVERFGYMGNGTPITGSRTRQEITLWQEWRRTIGPWDAGEQRLGGWSLNVRHAYDPVSRVLYFGDGGRRSAEELGYVITTVAGNGTMGSGGDGGPATQASLTSPFSIAVGPDGSLYIVDPPNHRVHRVDLQGMITTVAGNGSAGFSGDGGPATHAQLDFPAAVAVGPDGSLYISDSGNHRIRRVGPDGVITTVAGTGRSIPVGDGGPAVQAGLHYPWAVAVGPDSSLYIGELFRARIRRIGPDGLITTVAGNGTRGYSGDGGPATQAQLNSPYGVAVGVDGGLYIADSSNARIRRVGSNGLITTVAGTGSIGFGGDGGPATEAQFDAPLSVAVGPEGQLYIADFDNNRIRRIGSDGLITTVAGNGSSGFSGDGGSALQAQLNFPATVAVGPDGALYIADLYNSRVRRVERPMTGFSLDDIVIPSDDGSEVYLFDRSGRHLQTLNAFTGVMRYRMSYDSVGHLVALTDGDGNTTTIERDASGNPVALIAPFGRRMTLRLDAQGYLASVTDPAGHSTQLTYTADGLLTGMTTPNGHQYRFSYDPLGRLIRDEDPAGGFKALTRHELPSGFEVGLATALGRTTSYRVEEWPTGDRRRLNTLPSGLQEERWIRSNGRHITTLPDGTVHSLLLGPEPRFGMQAPLATHLQVTTPHGLVSSATRARTIALSDPHNPLSILTQTDTLTLNGNAYTTTFEATLRRLTLRTPAGRERVNILDAQGRVLEARVDGLEPIRYTYDSLGRLATVAHGARTSVLTYDAQGYLASLTDPLGRSVGFAYDLAGRLLRQTLPDGRELRYTYDANGNPTSLTPPGRPSHAFAYTPVDLAAAYLPPDLEAGPTPTQYAYNLDRQLMQVIRPDGTTIDMGYDGAGRLGTLTFPRGQLSSTYDPVTGHLTTIAAPDGGILTYGYDGSLLTSETWSGSIVGSVQYTYDNDFRLTSQHVNGEVLATFQYDADGLLTQAGALTLSRHPQHGLLTGSTIGQLVDTWTYTTYGERDTYRARFSGLEIFAVQYVRDALGRIIQKTEMLDGHTTIDTYEYDGVGRLSHVQRDGNSLAAYTYDSNGNRVSATSPDGTVTATYDVQDRLTHYGSTTYTYTANGEVQRKTTGSETTTYTYDALGNLTAVTLPDGTQIEYVIDGRNRRAGKKVNGTLVQGFLYSGQLRPVAELDGSGAMIARFIYGAHGNVPDYQVKGGRTYRILTDHLGSPRLVVDVATGHIAQRLAYDAFGRVVYDDNPGFQPFGFAGGLYDPDTKLTRFGVRDYDADTGRWTAKDPIRFLGGDPNLYGYVLNDPINWVDPWGLTQCDIDTATRLIQETYPDLKFPHSVEIDQTIVPDSNVVGRYYWETQIVKLNPRYLQKLSDQDADELLVTILHEVVHHNDPLWKIWEDAKRDHPNVEMKAFELARKIYDVFQNERRRCY